MDNWVYGLTKKQTSPTSPLGFKSKTDQWGAVDYPINPMKQAIAAGATFVARTTPTNPNHVLADDGSRDGSRRFQLHRMPERMRGILRRRVRRRESAQGRRVQRSPEDHDVTDELAAYKLAGADFPGYFGIFYKINKPTKNAKEAEINKPLHGKGQGPERLADSPEEFRPDEVVIYDLRFTIYESVEFLADS